jgi:hypothetical protein
MAIDYFQLGIGKMENFGSEDIELSRLKVRSSKIVPVLRAPEPFNMIFRMSTQHHFVLPTRF